MHGTQTGKHRVYRCAVIAMAARLRCGSWRFFRHTYRRAVAAIAPKRSTRTRFNQSISAVLAPIAWMVLSMCCLAALASFVGSYQRCELLDTRTRLNSLPAWLCRGRNWLGRRRRRHRSSHQSVNQTSAISSKFRKLHHVRN